MVSLLLQRRFLLFFFFSLFSDTFRGSLSRRLAAPPFPTLSSNSMSGVSGVTRRLCAPFYLLFLRYLIPATSPSFMLAASLVLVGLLALHTCTPPCRLYLCFPLSFTQQLCSLPSLRLSQIMAICLLFPPQKSPGRSSVCLSQDFFFPLLILLQLLLPGCLILSRASKRKRVGKKSSKLIPNPVPKWILFFLLQIFFSLFKCPAFWY